jgi:cbb3-type cytochrome oxidase maturation protein
MSVLYLLVIASIVVAALFLGAFIWSVRDGQYEDQQGAAMRMLHENEFNKSTTIKKQ